MEIPTRHVSTRVEPVLSIDLGIDTETLFAFDVHPAFWASFSLADDMVVLHPQTHASMPVIGVIKAVWRGVGRDQLDDLTGSALRIGKPLTCPLRLTMHMTSTLPASSQPHLALEVATEDRFVTLDRACERLAQFLGGCTTGAQKSVEPLPCHRAGVLAKALAVDRNPQSEHLGKSPLDRGWQKTRIPGRAHTVALAAIALAICQLVARAMGRFASSFHHWTSLNLIRLG